MKEEQKSNLIISIITVVYNSASTLEATILSVIGQSYSNIEFIIIDGGSTDGSWEIIKKYEKKIKYCISEPDKGIYDAMNKGLKVATGDFILFLGGDDVLNIDFNNIVPSFNPNVLYYGNAMYKISKQIIKNKFNRFSLVRHNVIHQCIFYPKIIFSHFQYDLKYPLYADWFLNYQCISLREVKKIYINQLVVVYNECGISGNRIDALFMNDQLENIKKYLGTIAFIYAFVLFKILRKIKKRIIYGD